MKHTIPTMLLVISLALSTAKAGFETWTRKDGKSAKLNLVGKFKLRNGRTYEISLRQRDKKRIAP